jgi:hypothetical protein
MAMKMQAVVLSASAYSFPDRQTGKINQGLTIHFYPETNFKPVITGETSRGLKPSKASLPYEFFESKIVDAPGIYDFDFTMEANSEGRPMIKVLDLKFIKPFETFGAPSPPGKV